MKVAQVAPPWYPIPPKGYGGIELIVSHLAEGLVDCGHEVTLFASGGSETKANLASVFDVPPTEQIGLVYPDLVHAFSAYLKAANFDIIHDHSGLIGPVLGSLVTTPVLHTLHGPATKNALRLYGMLGDRIYFNAISKYQRKCFGDLNFVATIYNSIDVDGYPFATQKDGYLLFLGRMNPEKGAHIAVEVAEKSRKKLLMVTKISEEREKRYFKDKVEPLLTKNVEIIGEVDLKTKGELYKNAGCTLFPIQWPEPFGLVMVESMATGTPVIAFRNGATPEVISHEKTGFVVDSAEEMVEAVKRADTIDPEACRREAEERFSTRRMVKDYERAYRKMLELEKSDLSARKAV